MAGQEKAGNLSPSTPPSLLVSTSIPTSILNFNKKTMIEPLSVIGGLGFSLAVISFLSNTVSTLVRQKHEFQQCEDRLKAYSTQIQSIQLDMLSWQSLWYGDQAFPEEAYIYFWGLDGYEGMKHRFQLIEHLIVSIKKHLTYDQKRSSRAGDKLPPADQLHWNSLISELELKPRPALSHRSYLGRIAFAISKNSELEEEMTRLRRLTEDLISWCLITFRQRQRVCIDMSLTREEVARIQDTRVLSEGLTDFAKSLFCAQKPYEWGLELRVPDCDGDATQTYNPASISMDFLIQGLCRCDRWTAGRFRIQYHTKHSTKTNGLPMHIKEEIRDQLESCTGTTKLQICPQQVVVLEEPEMTGRPIRRLLTDKKWYSTKREAPEEERMMAALGLVNWVCLLWYTSWTSIPCLCRIHPIEVENKRRKFVLESYSNPHTESMCLRAAMSDIRHKLFSLGRILAELTLSKPLGIVEGQNGHLLFIKDGEIVTKEEILQDLRRRRHVRDIGISHAIHYCLLTEDRGINERVERVREHAANIVQP